VPHFTLQVGSTGPMLRALIGVSSAREHALLKAKRPIPAPVLVQALVDTGASCTCVDSAVLKGLGLPPTGKIMMATPSTGAAPHTTDQYDVALVIPGADAGALPYMHGTLAVAECDLAAQGLQALIGRDVLKDCVFHYNGSIASFTLAF
jgi:hypothetical protein